eukprot:jgi/Bigna1/74864/fgenesh1_pg.31_\
MFYCYRSRRNVGWHCLLAALCLGAMVRWPRCDVHVANKMPEIPLFVNQGREKDPDALTYDPRPAGEMEKPPVIRFEGPSKMSGGKLKLQAEISSYEAYKQDKEVFPFPKNELVCFSYLSSPIYTNFRGRMSQVHDIFVYHRYRRQGIALTLLTELGRLHPEATIEARFSNDPWVDQDRIALWRLFGRNKDEPRYWDTHPRFRTVVEVLLSNGTLKRKKLQRIIVDPNIYDKEPLRRLKWPGDERVRELAANARRDPTEIPKFVMTDIVDPKVVAKIEAFHSKDIEKLKKKRKKGPTTIRKVTRSIRARRMS